MITDNDVIQDEEEEIYGITLISITVILIAKTPEAIYNLGWYN